MARTIPKYVLFADQLIRDIQSGKYRVGDKLPTESELMVAFGASRYTVRSTLRLLRNRRIAESRQGSGSVVISTGAEPAFTASVQSLDELVAFALETSRTIIETGTATADQELAEIMNCGAGRRLAWAHMRRTKLGAVPDPVSVFTIWVDAPFEPAIADMETTSRPVAEIIGERFGYTTEEVVQTITVGTASLEVARELGVDVNEPVLIIERTYWSGSSSSAHVFSRTFCPSKTVKLVTRFRAISGE